MTPATLRKRVVPCTVELSAGEIVIYAADGLRFRDGLHQLVTQAAMLDHPPAEALVQLAFDDWLEHMPLIACPAECTCNEAAE